MRGKEVAVTLMLVYDFPPKKGGIQTMMHQLAGALSSGIETVVFAPEQPGSAEYDASSNYKVVRKKYPDILDRYDGIFRFLSSSRHLKNRPRTGFFDNLRKALAADVAEALRLNNVGTIQCGHICMLDIAKEIFEKHAVPYTVYAYGQEIASVLHSPSEADKTHLAELLNGAFRVFTISDYTKLLLEKLGVLPERIVKIPLGVSGDMLREGDGKPIREKFGLGDSPVLLTVARLVKRKGQQHMIRVLPELMRRIPGIKYLLVGDGENRRELESLAADLGVSESVIFAGEASDEELADYYAAGDLFVMTSDVDPGRGVVEGFGIVYLEANAQGKPVVGFRSGGVPDAVIHGETGLLVEPGDYEGLTDAICSIISEKRLAVTMGKSGRERVKKIMTWRNAATTVTGILDEMEQMR